MKTVLVKPAKPFSAYASSDGFTLVELMIVLVIMAMAAGASYSILYGLSRSYTGQNVVADTQQDMRVGIDYMIRDIRMAGLDPLRTGQPGVVDAQPNRFSFTADRNMDGDPDDTGEQITFVYSGKSVQLVDNLGTVTLSDKVTDFSFTYLDKDDAVTSDFEHIRTVLINMTIRSSAGNHKPIQRTSAARVRCRNLGL
jgi:type IV pilus assembly protein PilW